MAEKCKIFLAKVFSQVVHQNLSCCEGGGELCQHVPKAPTDVNLVF